MAPEGFLVLERFVLRLDAVKEVERMFSSAGFSALSGAVLELDFARFLLREALDSGRNAGGAVVSISVEG